MNSKKDWIECLINSLSVFHIYNEKLCIFSFFNDHAFLFNNFLWIGSLKKYETQSFTFCAILYFFSFFLFLEVERKGNKTTKMSYSKGDTLLFIELNTFSGA